MDINDRIRELVDGWCARRELGPLATVLPEWLSNNGLTDGWAELGKALRSASFDERLTVQERETLKLLWIEIDTALRYRS
jgi:hypothetical protein